MAAQLPICLTQTGCFFLQSLGILEGRGRHIAAFGAGKGQLDGMGGSAVVNSGADGGEQGSIQGARIR